ncbi:hypothetical protein KC19_VG145600 [Ceratodon purpureus]|uniref:PCI domain-containing protein n=1 Tax=Ceratodon purpureus TaxID=3225 RepID=A0A8T0HQQ4_CERPU|nr:hypothetical protein KC19_VG145600 [Ceratodon purpureus]
MAGVKDESDNWTNLYGVTFSRDLAAYSDPGNAWVGQHYNTASQQQEQHWYGYYLPQQPEDMRQSVQEGVTAPPLPTVPPPQAPLPPSLATTSAWTGDHHAGADGGTETYSGYNHYIQQQQDQGQEYAGHGEGDAQGYAGYSYMSDQNVDGSMYYQGHADHGYQKQGTEVYPQNPAVYSGAVVPYAPSMSYRYLGTHIDTAPHGRTENYDPSWSADYGNSGDGEQAQTSWNYLNQGRHRYAGCLVPMSNSNAACSDVNSRWEDNVQYAQDYTQQWADYYSSLQAASQANTENNGARQAAPGGLGTVAQAAAQTYARVVAAPTPQQPPPPGTAVPRLSCPASMVSHGEMQGSQVSLTYEAQSAGTVWNGVPNEAFQSGDLKQSFFPPMAKHKVTPATPYQQEPFNLESINARHSIQQQQSKAVKLHIVTNSQITRIVGDLDVGNEIANPAYVSVPAKSASPSSLSTNTFADGSAQPGMFPSSLRAYVERALSRCKDESQKGACQNIMKDMITTSSLDGTLFTRDWDIEPLFAIPSTSSLSTRLEMSLQQDTSTKLEWSPARRLKTRWESPAAEESDDKTRRTLCLSGTIQVGVHDSSKAKDSRHSYSKWGRQGTGSKTNFKTPTTTGDDLNMSKRGSKRFRKGQTLICGENASSESEEESDHGVRLGYLLTASTSEEKVRRQNRFKRFDRGIDIRREDQGLGRGQELRVGSASARRATALQLALNSVERQNGRAVEDIDWDSLTIRGICQEVEKRYLRLTSAPNPQTVRPEDVLRRALEMVKKTTKSYLFKCEQLKSIRQDLTVQRIRDEFTVEVYESHARVALEAGDLPEYNQCQTQLKSLYGDGIKGCSNEFAAYSLLYILFNRGNCRDLLSAMARLNEDGRTDDVVKHALAVRNAVAVGNYTTFFRLYRTAPVLSPFLMDIHIEKMRFEAVKCMTRSYRPTIPVASVARALGFTVEPSSGQTAEVEDCEEWLKAHGAQFQFDSSSNELVLETKLSATSLFMPEPEDVVPHGDANLALNDFFSRS